MRERRERYIRKVVVVVLLGGFKLDFPQVEGKVRAFVKKKKEWVVCFFGLFLFSFFFVVWVAFWMV